LTGVSQILSHELVKIKHQKKSVFCCIDVFTALSILLNHLSLSVNVPTRHVKIGYDQKLCTLDW